MMLAAPLPTLPCPTRPFGGIVLGKRPKESDGACPVFCQSSWERRGHKVKRDLQRSQAFSGHHPFWGRRGSFGLRRKAVEEGRKRRQLEISRALSGTLVQRTPPWLSVPLASEQPLQGLAGPPSPFSSTQPASRIPFLSPFLFLSAGPKFLV